MRCRILRSRTDLARKQKLLGFPMPVKLGNRQAWFPKAEVQRWLGTDRRASGGDAQTRAWAAARREGASHCGRAVDTEGGAMKNAASKPDEGLIGLFGHT